MFGDYKLDKLLAKRYEPKLKPGFDAKVLASLDNKYEFVEFKNESNEFIVEEIDNKFKFKNFQIMASLVFFVVGLLSSNLTENVLNFGPYLYGNYIEGVFI